MHGREHLYASAYAIIVPMPRMHGSDVRTIRGALGLTVPTFATVLGVHPSTVHRWEAAGTQPVVIEGVPWAVLAALRQRVVREQADPTKVKDQGQKINDALVVGGVLLALAALIAFASGEE